MALKNSNTWKHLLSSLLAVISLAAMEAALPGGSTPKYKFFPETISPDGTLILAWGQKLRPGENPEILRAVPYSERLDPAEFEVQDYVVPLRRQAESNKQISPESKVPVALPKSEYFSGPEGHEDKRGLSHAWAPASNALVVLYEGESGAIVLNYMTPATGRVVDLKADLFGAVLALIQDRFGAEEAEKCNRIAISRFALLDQSTLAADVTLSGEEGVSTANYAFRLCGTLKMEGTGATITVTKNRLLWDDDLAKDVYQVADEALEEELNRTYTNLRKTLSNPAKERLKAEQLQWLQQRKELSNPSHVNGFTRHRVEELTIRGDD